MKNQILHIELASSLSKSVHSFYVVDNAGVILSRVCESMMLDFLDKTNLNLFSRVTKKRLVKLLRKQNNSECQRVINDLTYTLDQKIAVKDDIAEINQRVKQLDVQDICQSVYEKLRDREMHPSGEFDSAGRWYAVHDHLINCRTPSRSWPYSQMTACRTLKYVKKVAIFYGCDTSEELLYKV